MLSTKPRRIKNFRKITKKPKARPAVRTIKKINLDRQQIEDSIRLKAYELYLIRLGHNESSLNDWLNAEKLVLQGK